MLEAPVNLHSPALRTAEAARDDALVLGTEADVLASQATLEAFGWERIDPEPDYFLTVVRSRPEVVRPHVALLPGGSAFVGRIEDVTVPTMLGYRELLRPRLRALTLVLGGVAGADSPAAAAAVVGHVQETLAAREADVALLPALRTDSALFAAAQSLPSALCRRHGVERRTHWTLRVPGSYDEFLRSRSKKTRENLRVYRNRLFRDFDDDVRLRVFREPGEADELFRDVGSVAARTYQHGLGAAFAATEAERELVLLDLERDRFRAYVLYVGGEPAAFWQGSAWNRTFFVGTPGYDPALASYSIGTYVLARVIEDLCADDAIDRLDFGSGEAEYKRRFGSESWEEADVAIFAARLRPIRVNLVQTAVEAGGAGAKRVLARTGLLGKLKRRWRARLAARSGDSPNG